MCIKYTSFKEEKLRLVIEEDEGAGYYLIVYPFDSNKSCADYLCDTFEEAINKAKKAYGISEKAWQRTA